MNLKKLTSLEKVVRRVMSGYTPLEPKQKDAMPDCHDWDEGEKEHVPYEGLVYFDQRPIHHEDMSEEPTLRTPRTRKAEYALEGAKGDFRTVQDKLGNIAKSAQKTVRAAKKATKKPSEDNLEDTVMEAESVRERVLDLQAEIEYSVQKVADTLDHK
ncbi:hypothetical protein FDECE_1067 [Fusarium decemcellulare]|nr:hypothetical protein FDECE_1067 [Fusarium decemcellulare]